MMRGTCSRSTVRTPAFLCAFLLGAGCSDPNAPKAPEQPIRLPEAVALEFDATGQPVAEFLAEDLPTLEAEGWEVSAARGLSLARLGREDAYSCAKRSAEGWFDFEFGIEWRGERLSLLPLVRRFLREAEETDKEGLVARLERRSFVVTLPAERRPGAAEAALVVPGQVLAPVVSHLLDAFDFGRGGPARRLRLDDWQLAAMAAAGLADEESAADVEERTALLRRLEQGVAATPARLKRCAAAAVSNRAFGRGSQTAKAA